MLLLIVFGMQANSTATQATEHAGQTETGISTKREMGKSS